MPNIGKVEKREITLEMERSYLDYAMSVIISRALPDVRDGLKPVHRRILYAMHQMGLNSKTKFRKSAAVIGETMAKYHPHGDSALYDSLTRMAQDFSMRYPLIDGQGNFGSIDGDSPAAMRYCLSSDSLVFTNKGLIPIKDISSATKEALINYQVLDYKGIKIRADKFFNSGKHKIIEIVTERGYRLKGSYNHPILCWGLNEFGFPTIEWKLLQGLSQEDHVVINRNFALFSEKNPDLKNFWPQNERYKNISLPSKMNSDLAFLLGALVAEGSFHQNQIIFNNQNKVFFNCIKNIILKEFPGAKIYERKIKGNCLELSLYHQRAVKFLENIGLVNKKSGEKEIPFVILRSRSKIVKSFLVGLFEGDGSVNINQDKRHSGIVIELAYHSKSLKLINQLKTLLLNFGIATTAPHQDKRNKCYKLLISGADNISCFQKRIGFFSNLKNEKLANINKLNRSRMSKTDLIPFLNEYLRFAYDHPLFKKYNFNRYNRLEANYSKIENFLNRQDKNLVLWLLKNRFLFDKIKNIRSLEEETVYSIHVQSACHSFVANGFINHNTEARLKSIGETLLLDIEKETVDFGPNYDGSRQEPLVLPSRLPQLLLNGSMGIAVGMATNIPPHNLREVLTAIVFLINKPKASIEDLMQFIQGPDFPTGGAIYDIQASTEAYTSGKGSIIVRGKANLGKDKIIISEIPYQVNKASLVEQIAKLIKDKKLMDIKDVRDESDRSGMRIVLELKKDAFPQKILNKLYNYSDLQKSFHFNILALVNGLQPKILSLKDILEEFIKHRREVVARRTRFELKINQARLHILDGLQKALEHIDAVIKTIKQSRDKEQAAQNLITKFGLTKVQAQAILEIKLQTLAGLERQKIQDELEQKKKLVDLLKSLLADPKKIDKMIIEELEEIKEKFGDSRRTKVYKSKIAEFSEEDLVPNEKTIIALTKDGYIKRVNPKIYKVQRRGGRGLIGMATKAEDVVINFISCNTHDNLFFFTNTGKVFKLKAFEVPEGSRVSRGRAIVNFLNLQNREDVSALMALPQAKYLVMATRNGIIKKTKLEEFENIRGSGLIAIKLKKQDELRWIRAVQENDEIVLITALGQIIRFKETDIRPMARTAAGVIGVRLNKDDAVIAMDVINSKLLTPNSQLLTITENGYGKRTDLKLYKTQKRSGKGIKAMKINNKNGQLVSALIIDETAEDLIVVSQKGQIIRMKIKEISQMGRTTQGIRIMRLENDRVSKSTTIS